MERLQEIRIDKWWENLTYEERKEIKEQNE